MNAIETLQKAGNDAFAEAGHIAQLIEDRYAELEKLRLQHTERNVFAEDCMRAVALLERYKYAEKALLERKDGAA